MENKYSQHFVETIQNILEDIQFLLGEVHIPEIEEDRKLVQSFIE